MAADAERIKLLLQVMVDLDTEDDIVARSRVRDELLKLLLPDDH